MTRSLFPGALYYTIWLGLIGTFLWRKRSELSVRLQSWSEHPFVKFIVLGYGAVLLEEVFAALSNHLREGFSFPLYVARIGQFWALNVFTFSGFILGWYWLLKRFCYSRREVFYVAGVWGLYAEKIYFSVLSNPMAVALLAAPTILTYGVIISPALMSLPTTGQRQLSPFVKYPLTYAIIFVFSMIPMLILITLRDRYPFLFPPRNLVP